MSGPRAWLQGLRYLWAAPNTVLGLSIGVLLAGRFRRVDGVIEVDGEQIAWALGRLWVPAAALTLGHCVLGRDRGELERTRRHERVHVRQCERWGPFFLPAYLLISLGLYLVGRDGYRDNPFEQEAYRSDRC